MTIRGLVDEYRSLSRAHIFIHHAHIRHFDRREKSRGGHAPSHGLMQRPFVRDSSRAAATRAGMTLQMGMRILRLAATPTHRRDYVHLKRTRPSFRALGEESGGGHASIARSLQRARSTIVGVRGRARHDAPLRNQNPIAWRQRCSPIERRPPNPIFVGAAREPPVFRQPAHSRLVQRPFVRDFLRLRSGQALARGSHARGNDSPAASAIDFKRPTTRPG
jgi:hypothetical protein